MYKLIFNSAIRLFASSKNIDDFKSESCNPDVPHKCDLTARPLVVILFCTSLLEKVNIACGIFIFKIMYCTYCSIETWAGDEKLSQRCQCVIT